MRPATTRGVGSRSSSSVEVGRAARRALWGTSSEPLAALLGEPAQLRGRCRGAAGLGGDWRPGPRAARPGRGSAAGGEQHLARGARRCGARAAPRACGVACVEQRRSWSLEGWPQSTTTRPWAARASASKPLELVAAAARRGDARARRRPAAGRARARRTALGGLLAAATRAGELAQAQRRGAAGQRGEAAAFGRGLGEQHRHAAVAAAWRASR